MEPLVVHPEVAAALAEGVPVVALETTLVAHGFPRPDNLRVAHEMQAEVRAHGAVPAAIAVVDGVVRVGLDDAGLERLAGDADVLKASTRDLAPAVASGSTAATTVSATSRVARLAGIPVLATGGLGGVHREATDSWDESPDLTALGTTGLVVVCSGVKSILDIAATLERLETLHVTVVGYGTDRFPAFYLADSGLPVDWRVDSAADVVAVVRARRALGLDQTALVVANPLPADEAMDPEQHDWVLRAGLTAAQRQGVRGKAVTPFLLDWMHRETGGASLRANAAIVRHNAALAADIAAVLATVPDTDVPYGRVVTLPEGSTTG